MPSGVRSCPNGTVVGMIDSRFVDCWLESSSEGALSLSFPRCALLFPSVISYFCFLAISCIFLSHVFPHFLFFIYFIFIFRLFFVGTVTSSSIVFIIFLYLLSFLFVFFLSTAEGSRQWCSCFYGMNCELYLACKCDAFMCNIVIYLVGFLSIFIEHVCPVVVFFWPLWITNPQWLQ